MVTHFVFQNTSKTMKMLPNAKERSFTFTLLMIVSEISLLQKERKLSIPTFMKT